MSETSKTIRVSEFLHARLRAESREDEKLSETLERLLDDPSLRELPGMLSDVDAETIQEGIDASHKQHAAELSEQFDGTE